MTREETLHMLAHTPLAFYLLDKRDEQGKPISNDYYDRIKLVDETGVQVYSIGIPRDYWKGVDTYDFASVDYMMDRVLKDHPNRYVVPRIDLNPPDDWCRKYPEELCVFYEGPQTPEEIRALVGTPYQCEASSIDQGERIGRQSISSPIWLEDAKKLLTALLDHLEKHPCANQVIGYITCFGEAGENLWWGFWPGTPQSRGDFGITHRKMFYQWAVKKYGSLDALRKAWKMPDLTAENLPFPTPFETWYSNIPDWKEKTNLRYMLLADDQRQVDCNLYHSEVTFDAMEALGRVVKEKTGKLVGAFYGYTLEHAAGYCGQAALDRAMTSDVFDFYSTPKSYAYCLAGDPGETQAPAQSFVRHKMWIEENDMRSYNLLKTNPNDTYAPKTWEDTRTCFWRELYRALVCQHSFWWMDINGIRDDWYTDEKMVAMLKEQSAFFKKWSPVPRKGISEILWVEDDASNAHMTTRAPLQLGLRRRLNRELRLCGAPMDRYRIEDLFDMDLSQYKFIVFQHAFVMPKEKWDVLRSRIRPDAHILWNYAAGLLDPEYNPDNQKAVTGFKVMETPDRLQHKDVYKHMYHHASFPIGDDYNRLAIQPEDGQEVLQESPDHYILTARVDRGQGKNIFAADMTLRSELLRKLLEDAGVTCYGPVHCTVYADDKLIGFFPRYDVQVEHTFEGQWRNVITGDVVTGPISIPVEGKKFAIFEKVL